MLNRCISPEYSNRGHFRTLKPFKFREHSNHLSNENGCCWVLATDTRYNRRAGFRTRGVSRQMQKMPPNSWYTPNCAVLLSVKYGAIDQLPLAIEQHNTNISSAIRSQLPSVLHRARLPRGESSCLQMSSRNLPTK